MEKNYILHFKGQKSVVITESQAIAEALAQEKDGVKPRYAWRDCKTGENLTPPGWLIWSNWEDGAGVVYRRSDGKMIVVTGWQGDFVVV